MFDNRPQRLYLAANLAIQIVPGLYVGGGLTFMSQTAGQLFLKGSVAVSDPDASSLVSKIDVDLVAVRYPQAGILWEATPWLSVGASYRHSFVLNLDQQFRIDGNIGNPGLTPVVDERLSSPCTRCRPTCFSRGSSPAARRYGSGATSCCTFDADLRALERVPGAGGEPDASGSTSASTTTR